MLTKPKGAVESVSVNIEQNINPHKYGWPPNQQTARPQHNVTPS